MSQLATITSQRQFTIPVQLFREIGYKPGQLVTVRRIQKQLIIEPAEALVEKLAGSVKVPQKFKKMSIEQMIIYSKKRHFAKKR